MQILYFIALVIVILWVASFAFGILWWLMKWAIIVAVIIVIIRLVSGKDPISGKK